MSDLQDDRKILEEGRTINLEKEAEDVVVPMREQLQLKLIAKLEEKDIGRKVVDMWTRGNADRSEWIARQEEYVSQVDEFIDPIYQSSTDWGSTLHMPTILSVCKTFHARMYAALFGIDPPFTMRARNGANQDRERVLEKFMSYTLKDWANEYEGVEAEVDDWLWDWILRGNGILKARWNRQFTRFVDIAEELIPRVELQLQDDGALGQVPVVDVEEKLVVKTEKVYEGPDLRRKPIENVLIVGGKGNPQRADAVLEIDFPTASDLYSLAEQKIFRKSSVEKVIKSGNSSETGDQIDGIKQRQQETAGENQLDNSYDLDRYAVIEAYLKVDVDGSGINSDVIVWVHKDTTEILRAVYLRTTTPTGLRPYFKIGFHRRSGANHDVGLAELLYSLGKEIDAIHNMRIDTGILTSLPWGFYRPQSAMKEEKLPVEPGVMIPTMDPQRDVFFPNLGNRTTFGLQEEAGLMNQVERLTSMNDMTYGMIQGQGITRTATGSKFLAGETAANLDIFIQRMNRGWKQALKYLFHMLQQKTPEGMEFRITGDDGADYFLTIKSREELAGMYDFELEANSSNSNPTLRLQRANQIYQITQNPMDLQLGIVSPRQRYEAVKNLLQAMDVRDPGRYIQEPPNNPRIYTPEEIANRLLRGIDVVLDPMQDLDGFIAFVDEILKSDELLGQFGQNDVAMLVSKQREAMQMKAALEQAAASQNVINQAYTNTNNNFGGELSARVESDAGEGVL